MVTIFILVLLIPVALCIFLLFQSSRSLYSHYQEQTEADNLRVKSILFDVTMNLYNVSESLADDSELADLLTSDYGSEQAARGAIDAYSGIYDIMYKDTSISSINLYCFNESIGDYSYFHTITPQVKQTDWYARSLSTASVFWEVQSRTDKSSNTYWELVLYRRIPLIHSNSFAVLAIAVSDNYLKNLIDNTTCQTVISVNQDPVFYSSQKKFLGNTIPLEIDYTQAYYKASGLLMLDGTKTVTALSTLVPLNCEDQIYLVSYDSGAVGKITSLVRSYILILCFTILLPCVLFFVYSRYFSGRVLMLRQAMHQASKGNYDIMDSFAGNDEISETFHDLRAMIREIKKKEARIYHAQLQEKELQNKQQQMEFKMLASQINPHFLYNTLETIRMKAFTVGDREVATAIKLLGKSLRYVLENTGTVSIPLAKEIDYIHTYIAIQKLRFGERINYCEQIDPELDLNECKVLPLLLQPIVENSISHGLKDMESGGLITLAITEEAELLNIRITDNGSGMTTEEREKLLHKINTYDETKTKSIGLSNINHRLVLCYGTGYHFEIESIPNCSTAVTLKLPLCKIKEDMTNESTHRRR